MRGPVSLKRRFGVLSRDRFTCQYCGRSAPHVRLLVDHCIPVSKGGSSVDFNLVTACEECNQGKSAIINSRLSFRQMFYHVYSTYLQPESYAAIQDGFEFSQQYIATMFFPVRLWLEPTLDSLKMVVGDLLKAAMGKPSGLGDWLGGTENPKDDGLRLVAAVIIKCLGPSPALIKVAERDPSATECSGVVKEETLDWLRAIEPVDAWLEQRKVEKERATNGCS